MARQLLIELVGKTDKFTKSLDTAGKEVGGFGDKVTSTGKKMTAFVSVPIVGFLAAGTKAAVEDAAAQETLAVALRNTTGATDKQVAAVEAYIGKAMKASTFTDDELRPAFTRLVTSTKNADEAQRLMSTAMDIAAGTGKDLGTITDALAKAHDGQTGALSRLGINVKDVEGKTLSFDQIMRNANQTFGGQAQAAADTTAGKMRNFSRDVGELSEKLGAQLLPAITSVAGFLTNTLIPTLDNLTGDNGALVLLGVAAAGPVLSNVVKLKNAIVGLNLTLDATAVKAAAALGALGVVIAGIQQVKKDLNEGGLAQGILGSSPISRFLDRTFHSGGVVPGTPGQTVPILAMAGETVVPAGRSGGGSTVVVNVSGVGMGRDFGDAVARALRDNRLIGVTV